MSINAEKDIQIYLASQSPRRQQLLSQIAIKFELLSAEINETPAPDEMAEDYVCRMAREKAQHAWKNLSGKTNLPVLAADTCIVFNGKIMGKPRDKGHALEMLYELSNSQHQVLSAVALLGVPAAENINLNDVSNKPPKLRVLLNCSTVIFRPISEEERLYYWETGESRDKSGAYAIQGLGAIFVKSISGSYSSVMGLPLYETEKLLTEFGISVLGK